MNLRQLQYAIVLSRVLNISQAAQELNISQPALSKQILSLEKELGVVLFDRNSIPLSLTAAGECFIKNANDILLKEKELKRSMQDFKLGEKARLTIGISPFRATYFISDTIKKLQAKYVGLQVVLKEHNSAQLCKNAVDGQVDFTIMNLPVDESVFDIIPLSPEPLVLAVSKKLFSKKCDTENLKNGEYPIINFSDCKDIPFIALSKKQELRQLFDKLCNASDFVPNISTEVVGINTAWSLVQAEVGATILPLKLIDSYKTNNDILVFAIENIASVRKPAIILRKGQYVSKYAKEAIELLVNR